MGLDSVLFLTENFNENLYLASRNLPKVAVVEAKHADPVALLFDKVLVTKGAMAQLEEMFA